LTSSDPVNSLFGSEALAIRNYSDSKGEVDYSAKKGGELRPIISEERPINISYNTRNWEMSVKFYFEKHKAFLNPDGAIIFKSVL